jgi:hypothetical protein
MGRGEVSKQCSVFSIQFVDVEMVPLYFKKIDFSLVLHKNQETDH